MVRRMFTVFCVIIVALYVGLAGCVSIPVSGGGVTGAWHWFNGGVVRISPDFAIAHADGTEIQDTGTWEYLPGPGTRIRLKWTSGWTDTLELSADGKTLQGTNQEGEEVSGTRD